MGAELPEDAAFLRPLLPNVPVRPVRFIRAATYDLQAVPPLGRSREVSLPTRRGMLMMGSAHTINVEAVVFVLDHVLPVLQARQIPSEEIVLHVIGENPMDK